MRGRISGRANLFMYIVITYFPILVCRFERTYPYGVRIFKVVTIKKIKIEENKKIVYKSQFIDINKERIILRRIKNILTNSFYCANIMILRLY